MVLTDKENEMAYVDNYSLLFDEANDLHKKVAVAILSAARDVKNESKTAVHHKSRLAWARWLRQAPGRAVTEAHRAMSQVLDNAAVASSGNLATDIDVQFVVNGLVDTLSRGGYR